VGIDYRSSRMGGLAWLRYLSHTQVIESSNLSPSILLKKDYEKISMVTNTAEVIARKILVMFIDLFRAIA
jgi:hypothetical protein